MKLGGLFLKLGPSMWFIFEALRGLFLKLLNFIFEARGLFLKLGVCFLILIRPCRSKWGGLFLKLGRFIFEARWFIFEARPFDVVYF